MEDYRFGNVQNLAMIALLVMLISLINEKKDFKQNDNISNSYLSKARMIKEIKPYFHKEDQFILSKVQDIFEILSKVNRIVKSEYNEEIKSLYKDKPIIDRKEKILSIVSNYVNDNNRKMAETAIETKRNIFKTKDNLKSFSQTVSTSKLDKLTTISMLAKSIEPIVPNKSKAQIRKLEKILKILQASD